MRFLNMHERRLPVPTTQVGSLLDSLASENDQLWPWETWPAQAFDGPLAIGARGGHGPIRYTVVDYQPGCRVRYRFDPATGFEGVHGFDVEACGDQTIIRHILFGEGGVAGYLKWALLFRWLHDALIEDALDKAERATTQGVRHPARWSPYVRFLREVLARRVGR